LIWDLENISMKFTNQIFKQLPYTPEHAIVVTKQKLNFKKLKYLMWRLFTIEDTHKTISDDKIKELIRKYNPKELILISSDSDFSPTVNSMLKKNKKVYWVFLDKTKSRLLMKTDISNSNLKLISIKGKQK